MLIATLLSGSQLVRVSDAADDLRAKLDPTRDWDHLRSALRDQPVSLMVVDPFIGNTVWASEVVRLLADWPSTPVVVYTQLTVESARILAALGRRGLRDVVLYQYDDARLRLARTLRTVASSRISARIRNALFESFMALPVNIAVAIEDLFERPHAFQAGLDIATAAGEPKSTLFRALRGAGLASPRRLFVCARVAHAAMYLQDPGLRVQDAAAKLGYARPDVLTRHTMEVFGVRPSAFRRRDAKRLTEDDIVARLVAWSRQQDGE